MNNEIKEKLENITEAEALIIVFSKGNEGDLIVTALLEGEQYAACNSLQEKGILQSGPMGMMKITSEFEEIRDELRKNFKINFAA